MIGTTTYTIVYSWDAATGELSGTTYRSGLSLTYARDASGQITSMSANDALLVPAVSHLPFGPFILRNYKVIIHQFDANGKIISVSDPEGGAWNYIRSYDAAGNAKTDMLTAEGNLT